jgi:CheY-like chemotaxis protein/HPt (histidine-containing phosphotransfer) domain-containing protein
LHEALAQLGRPLRVLLAEDNATNQLVVKQMLREFSIDLTIASDGAEALTVATQRDFDAILMDIRMPHMDGLAVTRMIRAGSGTRALVPIIALTANAFADDMKACRDAGMTDFLAKPLRKRLLVDAFMKAVAELQSAVPAAERALVSVRQEPKQPTEAITGDIAPIDWSAIETLREEIGAESVEAILRVFLVESEERIARLNALAAAGDLPAFQVEAHTLKGAAGSMGFMHVAMIALALEKNLPAGVDRADLLVRLDAAFHSARDELISCMALSGEPR